MRGIEGVNAIKQTLFESLGENCKEYRILMNKWFKMQITRQEFENEVQRQEVNTDLPSFILQDRLLPDGPSMISRTTYAAWEHGLENAGPGVAELLATATNQFLRNIIVAIIRKRKGCCFKNNGFVYSLVEGLLTPASRISREELYHRQLFSFASSDAPNITLAPISVNDLIYTLQLHPSLIASYFTKTVNIERMIARVNYPSDD
ncbi:hypothetical protein O3M35_001789 [Rhynocoris fuscipes]|uniref:Transcriptional adapter 1 n=1 Tax=Rhynocoris fuscipes TaxID=488301 RepID=A0AAW1CSS1_9HEMI